MSDVLPALGPETSRDALAAVRVAELSQMKDKLLRLRQLREQNGLSFYRPHLKQHRFHTCLATARYGRTGNRFGKSEMGIAEDIAMALGGRLWYRSAFDILHSRKVLQPDGSWDGKSWETYVAERHEGGHNHPYVTAGIPQRPLKGLILVVNWDMAKSIFTNREGSYDVWGKLWKLLPADAIGKITNGGRGDRVEKIEIKRPVEFGGGSSTLTFDTVESYKHSKIGAESADWDFIHVDEPIPEKMFKGFARGLMDRDGKYWFTCTPLDEMWINDLFCPPGQHIVKDADKGFTFDRKYIITGSIYDNPHRNEAGVAEFESTLTREEKACRLHGLPMAFAGLIYPQFIYDLHVLCDVPKGWKNYDDPPLDYTIRVAWDVHHSRPQAILCIATSPDGISYACKEFWFDRMIEPNAQALKEWLKGRNVIDLLIDPFAVNPDARDDHSILDDLWEQELYFEKASKDLTLGISRVREKLLERTATGLPRICFSPELTETLYEFSHYVYDSEKGKPKDADDHMMENLYRLVLAGLDYVPPFEKNDYKPRKPLVVSPFEDLDKKMARQNLLRL